MKHDCPICRGVGWVCENCPDQPWSEDIGCICGAGMLCQCQRKNCDVAEGIEASNVSRVLNEQPIIKK